MDDELARRSTDLIIKLQNELADYRTEAKILRRALDHACGNNRIAYEEACAFGKAQLESEFPKENKKK